MSRLTQLQTGEISLVPTGANKKKFLVLKADLGSSERNRLSDESFALPEERKYPIHDISHARNALARSSGKSEEEKVRAAVYRKYPSLKPNTEKDGALDKISRFIVKSFGKKDDDQQINGKLEGLSPAAQTAARAVGRILAPHADELKGSHVKAVLDQAGIEGGSTDSPGGSKLKPEDKKAASEAAMKAYKECMEKMGYKKYPEASLQMKEDDGDDEEAKKAKAAKMKKEQEEAEEAEKAKKAKEAKVGKESIFKEDGSINLEAVPAEQRPMMEAIGKMMAANETRAKAAEAALAETQRVLKEQRESNQKAEIVRKSFEFKNLSQPFCQSVLELAIGKSAEEYEKVVKGLEAQNAQMGQSGIFTEVGKAGMSDGALSAWSKIEKAAEGIVQKSATKITKEMAITDFLETAEGQALYAQHQASRPNGI